MYKAHIQLIRVIAVVSFCLSYFLGLQVDNGLLNGLMTFLSIIFGSNLTAISTLYSKDFAPKLHRLIDPEKPGQTQLQTLRRYFSISCGLTLTNILYLVVVQLIVDKSKYIVLGYIDIELALKSLVLPFVTVNITILWMLLRVFLKGFEHEANNQT